MKIFLIAISFITLLLLAFSTTLKSDKATVQIKDIKFSTEVVENDEDKQIGLSKYDDLKNEDAMLFVFEDEGIHPFWMKGMKFPIDIIYLRNGKITEIYPKVPPPRYIDGEIINIDPKEKADHVLEINSGLSEKYKFKEGDTVRIEK